jgi:hypothetical protein
MSHRRKATGEGDGDNYLTHWSSPLERKQWWDQVELDRTLNDAAIVSTNDFMPNNCSAAIGFRR